MLQVAKISSMNVDTTAIKAVAKELRTTGATDKSIAAEQGVSTFADSFKGNLFPSHARAGERECPDRETGLL
jgi:hypothetical protein